MRDVEGDRKKERKKALRFFSMQASHNGPSLSPCLIVTYNTAQSITF